MLIIWFCYFILHNFNKKIKGFTGNYHKFTYKMDQIVSKLCFLDWKINIFIFFLIIKLVFRK